MEFCNLNLSLPIRVFNAGLFVSRGSGQHPDRVFPYYDLIFVRGGRLGIQEDDRAFLVDAGEAVLLWPGRRHFGTLEYADDLSFYWIHFQVNEEATGGDWSLDVPQHVAVARPEAVMELFRRFLDDQEATSPGPSSGGEFTKREDGDLNAISSNLVMMLMLAELARSREADQTGRISVPAGRAKAFIQANFHEPLTACIVADAIGCNPNYLARVFRETYGKTMTDDIHDRRLRYARGLLIDSLRNVDEISRRCGFADSVYFRRLFKRAHGMTPLAFRKLYARVHVNTE